MKKLYKNGKECTADDNQVGAMLKGGWSLEKPVEEVPIPEEKEEAEELTDEEEESSPTLKKIQRRKLKKTDSEE